MVRRRSTVRFRNGAPGHGQFSNDSDERRGPSPGDALQLPLRRKLPLHSESPVAVTEGSRRRAVPGQSGQCPGEVTLDRSSSGRAVQASMSGIKILGPPGGCWCHPARRSGGLTSGWGMAASPGWAATSEAKTPARRYTPSGSGTSSSWTGLVRCSAPYAHADHSASSDCMLMHVRV